MLFAVPYRTTQPRAKHKSIIEQTPGCHWIDFSAHSFREGRERLAALIRPGDPRPLDFRRCLATFQIQHSHNS